LKCAATTVCTVWVPMEIESWQVIKDQTHQAKRKWLNSSCWLSRKKGKSTNKKETAKKETATQADERNMKAR
jgi:hypothetical protein